MKIVLAAFLVLAAGAAEAAAQDQTMQVCAADAQRLGLADRERVRVRSRYGETLLPVRVSASVKTGELFATFHDPAVCLNNLTGPQRDRFVKTPEYKVTAVRIERI